MEKLNIDEVMALQMSGMPTSQIIKTDLAEFDRLYADTPEFDGYLD